MIKRQLPTPELLRKLLRYVPVTGKLFWRERPVEMFSDNGNGQKANASGWNTRYANKEAFTSNNTKGYRIGHIKRIRLGRLALSGLWKQVSGRKTKSITRMEIQQTIGGKIFAT